MLWVAGGSMCERMCVTASAVTALAGTRQMSLNLVYMVSVFNINISSEHPPSECQSVGKIQETSVFLRKYGGAVEGTLGPGLSFGLQNPPLGAHLAWKTVEILA